MIWYDLKQCIQVFSKDLAFSVGEESHSNRVEKFFVFTHCGDSAVFLLSSKESILADIGP